jgi:dTDP-4-amino-4,6-dideoxygalactose transaminase
MPSAKEAFMALFKAIPLAPGANVLVSSCSSDALWEAMEELALTPVIREPDPYTLLLDGSGLGPEDWSRLDAIVITHLYGRPAHLEALMASARKFGVFVVEDASQAHGAEYRGKKIGSFGDAAVFCVRPGRLLADEEGGAVVVSSLPALMEKLSAESTHRFSKQANARLCARLKGLDERLGRREKVASMYRERLGSVEGLRTVLPERQGRHVYYRFVIRVPEAEKVRALLSEKGVDTGGPRFSSVKRGVPLPLAQAVERETLFLPMGDNLEEKTVDAVVRAVSESLAKVSGSRDPARS